MTTDATSVINRRVILKNGKGGLVRFVREEDAADLLEITRLVHELEQGVVRTMDEIPQSVDEQRKELQSWTKGMRSPPNGLMLVCEVEGRARGDGVVRRRSYARMHHCGHIGLSVHPDWQELGIGRAIMDSLITWACSDESDGMTRLDLSALAYNHRAIALYESLGFEHEGVRAGSVMLGDGSLVDEVLMGMEVGG